MFVNLFCPICMHEATQRGDPTYGVQVPIVDLRDDGVYNVECEEGHQTRVRLVNLRFELLFEVGAYALRDARTREAVSSFAAALERFYEFYTAVALDALGVDSDKFDAAWKPVSKQSERQLGFFIAAHLGLTHEPPTLLNPNTHVQLRNKVVHQGYVPDPKEALGFGETVLELLDGFLNDLRERCPDSVSKVFEKSLPPDLEEIPQPDGSEEVVGSTNILPIVDVQHPREHDNRAGSLATQVERLRNPPRTRMRALTREQLLAERPDLADQLYDDEPDRDDQPE